MEHFYISGTFPFLNNVWNSGKRDNSDVCTCVFVSLCVCVCACVCVLERERELRVPIKREMKTCTAFVTGKEKEKVSSMLIRLPILLI